jgi:regulatory protein
VAVKSCYDKACELLAQRPHFRRELERKLRQRDYPPADLDAALERLEREGYLNDLAAARSFVVARQGRGEGGIRLRAELERRGAAVSAIATVLAELPEDDLPAARAAAARRRDASPEALARHLARKGFSRRAIFAVLNERPAGAGPSAAALDMDAADDLAEPPEDPEIQ